MDEVFRTGSFTGWRRDRDGVRRFYRDGVIDPDVYAWTTDQAMRDFILSTTAQAAAPAEIPR